MQFSVTLNAKLVSVNRNCKLWNKKLQIVNVCGIVKWKIQTDSCKLVIFFHKLFTQSNGF